MADITDLVLADHNWSENSSPALTASRPVHPAEVLQSAAGTAEGVAPTSLGATPR